MFDKSDTVGRRDSPATLDVMSDERAPADTLPSSGLALLAQIVGRTVFFWFAAHAQQTDAHGSRHGSLNTSSGTFRGSFSFNSMSYRLCKQYHRNRMPPALREVSNFATLARLPIPDWRKMTGDA